MFICESIIGSAGGLDNCPSSAGWCSITSYLYVMQFQESFQAKPCCVAVGRACVQRVANYQQHLKHSLERCRPHHLRGHASFPHFLKNGRVLTHP